ncbi:Asp23/Gls24 family envelope stress response protein [Microbacterium sp. cx-59]|uniref:Asp23/Gls24 family envelope stress response protein n=1 Tax=Microbacterium sp. cx-59 TaxID=2891207 RepID=UPI001E2DF6F7|nr:Asp23/Gls24 family envelope stress response protein [Microbacterium sp. cx-59]MCC4908340.1 Asp23/Gls24 family envelope stress response protein [Microbacterium sp. cx-59]
MNASSDRANILDCGKSIEELSLYLESGRTPPDPAIDECPECLNALDSLERVSGLSRELLESDAAQLPEPSSTWVAGIMDIVSAELRAGRELPIRHPDPKVRITVTEGAVRGLLRSVADDVAGVYVGRTEIVGDAETLGAPVAIALTASVAWGVDVGMVLDRLRRETFDALQRHTDLNVTGVDVTVEDVHGWELRKDDR